MVNFYNLLKVSPTASEEEIKKAINRELWVWSNRINAPQIERRQEAERMVKQLEEAARILLDAAKEKPPEPQLGKIRFTKAKDGVISDSATGLEWYVGPRDTSWNQVKSWTESLTVAGGGWRMPTVPELKTLFQEGASPYNMDLIFQNTGPCVFSGQLRDALSAWFFYFEIGQESWDGLDGVGYGRAFAVRSRQ